MRKISSAGDVTILAGGVGASGNVDGVGSDARFASLIAIAADPTADYTRPTMQTVLSAWGAPMCPLSRERHTATPGPMDISLPLSGIPGIESRSGGPDGNHEILVSFLESVNVSAASISDGTGERTSVEVDGATIRLELSGVANAQTATLTLHDVSTLGFSGAQRFASPRFSVT